MAATNRSLAEQVRSGKFRQDLYYRLNVVRIEIPPLSRRREDIPLLTEHFLNIFNLKRNKNITGVSDDVMDFLMRYPFPETYGSWRILSSTPSFSVIAASSK